MFKTFSATPTDIQQDWYVVDAEGMVLGRLATEIARMIKAKEITAVEAVKRFYARIDQVNPKINAVVAFCRERALAEAETMFTIRTQYVAFELWQRERLIQRGDRKAP